MSILKWLGLIAALTCLVFAAVESPFRAAELLLEITDFYEGRLRRHP